MRSTIANGALLLLMSAAVAAGDLPEHVAQGGLAFGRVPPGTSVTVDGRPVRVSSRGEYVFAAPRDRTGSIEIVMSSPGAAEHAHKVMINPRRFNVERINGVPPATVNPPAAIAKRIAREQAAVAAVRIRDDDRQDWSSGFALPVHARVSGHFGSQRVYNGTPGSAHSGMDLAAPQGTAVAAPASGIVTFADSDLYLTGGTVVLDHGQGVSSTFLHLSRIDVKVGDSIRQGETLGAVGSTGRATGPHLHWGMNWFDVRVDPELLVQPAGAANR